MRALAPPNPKLSREFMAAGACKGKTALFFPATGQPGTEAGAVCAACPVRAACAEYADRSGAVGFWAGKWRGGTG